MNLKPQDIVILLKLVADGSGESRSYASLALSLGMSPSEVHAGVKRLANARLLSLPSRKALSKPVLEFLLHGVKYAFPPRKGGITIGYPTAYAAAPLNLQISASSELPPVWPSPDGPVKGQSFSPLYKSVPDAVREDSILYELLALVDAVRDGRARERELAEKELTKRIESLA